MNSREESKPSWSVFDGVKTISLSPETLMTDINTAITSLEYARATANLQSAPRVPKDKSSTKRSSSSYDARMADDAYKTGLASMAAGKLDEAVVSLNVALSKCPPDKTSAVAKLQSLISVTSEQIDKSNN